MVENDSTLFGNYSKMSLKDVALKNAVWKNTKLSSHQRIV